MDARDLDSPSYMVSLVGDRLRIETRVAWVKRERAEANAMPRPLPPRFKISLENATVHWSPGEGLAVEDGWLNGYDAGEFGGGLYWFAKDGSRYRKIDGRNTPIVAKTSKGIFAVQALAHLMFSYSSLVEVYNGPKGWTTRHVTDLHESPMHILQAGDHLLYATNEYVSTLETDGTQREIYRSWSEMGVDSMVRRRNGEVWIGAAHGLLRLTPKPNGEYAAQWFLPVRKASVPLRGTRDRNVAAPGV